MNLSTFKVTFQPMSLFKEKSPGFGSIRTALRPDKYRILWSVKDADPHRYDSVMTQQMMPDQCVCWCLNESNRWRKRHYLSTQSCPRCQLCFRLLQWLVAGYWCWDPAILFSAIRPKGRVCQNDHNPLSWASPPCGVICYIRAYWHSNLGCQKFQMTA